MKLIVAVDEDWGIGLNNKLLFKIPNDLNYFKKHTEGKVVIMGRKTFESLPNAKPLPNRLNIILTSNKLECQENMITCKNIDEVFKIIKKMNTDDIFIIGGEKIYNLFLKYCNEALITKVFTKKRRKNKFFPNLDELKEWIIIKESKKYVYKKINYQFITYLNNNCLKY